MRPWLLLPQQLTELSLPSAQLKLSPDTIGEVATNTFLVWVDTAPPAPLVVVLVATKRPIFANVLGVELPAPSVASPKS